MIVEECGKRIALLGDPHLGKQFVHGVPLHRRGERERLVWEDFSNSLVQTGLDYHVNMGDLFDKWIVSFDLIIQTAQAYRCAANSNPGTRYVVLKGNHDWVKDLERASAFDVFAALVRDEENIVVVDSEWDPGEFLFCAWHPINNAHETVSYYDDVKVAFGHWDTEFGEHNMVPTKAGVPKLYTGHVHKPTKFTRDGTEVVVVGSMQPYAHGEEINDDLYITLTPEEMDDHDLTNKCVRIVGDFDGELDCLQLTIKREAQDSDIPDVSFGDFDMDALFRKAFSEAGVSSEITETVLGQYHEKRIANGA